jgi:DNA-binding NtrC family response regulator
MSPLVALTPREPVAEIAWAAVATVFGSLGRVFVCMDGAFRIVHASPAIDDILGAGRAAAAAHQPVATLLGDELFGADGALRLALARGERREGWHAVLTGARGEPRPFAVTVAPLCQEPGSWSDARVAYVAVLRPVEAPDATPTVARLDGLVARSAAMRQVFQLIEDLAPAEPAVLITGESGTGKEGIARALHARSPRAHGPFVAVNCAALPAELLESDMFGHVRGAFTGAIRDRDGRFALARGGTLFLDEVADLPIVVQAKLLRVLQERTYERVGESRAQRADVRIVAATHVDLGAAAASGAFREDLYYRLRVVPIDLPPLRARPEDVEPLTKDLLGRMAASTGRLLRVSPDALQALARHAWPGNVRELQNALEYAAAVCKGQTILPGHLPAGVGGHATPPISTGPNPGPAVAPPLQQALDQHHWHRAETARALGISRVTLWRRMRDAGLH